MKGTMHMNKQYMLYEISHTSLDLPKPIPAFFKTPQEAFVSMVSEVSEHTGTDKEKIMLDVLMKNEHNSKAAFVCEIFALMMPTPDKEDILEWAIYEIDCDDKGTLKAHWGPSQEIADWLKRRGYSVWS